MKNQFVGKVGAAEVLTYIFLTLVLIFAVLPLFFMATAAFMDAKQIMSMPYTWIPSSKYFTTSTRTFLTNSQPTKTKFTLSSVRRMVLGFL